MTRSRGTASRTEGPRSKPMPAMRAGTGSRQTGRQRGACRSRRKRGDARFSPEIVSAVRALSPGSPSTSPTHGARGAPAVTAALFLHIGPRRVGDLAVEVVGARPRSQEVPGAAYSVDWYLTGSPPEERRAAENVAAGISGVPGLSNLHRATARGTGGALAVGSIRRRHCPHPGSWGR